MRRFLTCIALILLLGTPAWAIDVTLGWDASIVDATHGAPDGYRIFWRHSGQSYNYGTPAWQGPTLAAMIFGLTDETTHFVARAYNQYGESGDSNEATYTPTTGPVPGSPLAFHWVTGQPMALDYFGQQTHDSDDTISPSSLQLSWYKTKTFACPGEGNRTVEELSVYCDVDSGTPKIRVGIYTTAGALVAESNEITVTGTSLTWQGGMSAAQIRPAGGNYGDPVTITGGTSYRLAFAETNGGGMNLRYQSGGSNGNVEYDTGTDYTAGLPTSQTDETDWTGWWAIRCGLTAGGASAMLKMMMQHHGG